MYADCSGNNNHDYDDCDDFDDDGDDDGDDDDDDGDDDDKQEALKMIVLIIPTFQVLLQNGFFDPVAHINHGCNKNHMSALRFKLISLTMLALEKSPANFESTSGL